MPVSSRDGMGLVSLMIVLADCANNNTKSITLIYWFSICKLLNWQHFISYIFVLAAINLDTSQTFGDKSKFAIHYRTCPDKYNYTPTHKMAICHLIFSDNLIGQPDEECYLPTWIFSLTDRRKRIVDTKHLLFPKEFEGLTDREIFETILKANQFEEEFHPDFLYLPKLDNKFWSDHHFTLDETIDGYLIFFYVKDNQITFLIEDETESLDSDYRSYKFIFHSVDFDFFIKIIDKATEFLLLQYPYLKDNVSSRTFNSS